MWIFCRVEACREALTAVVVSRPRSLRSMALVGISIPPIRYRLAAKSSGQICTFLSFLYGEAIIWLPSGLVNKNQALHAIKRARPVCDQRAACEAWPDGGTRRIS